MEFSCQEDKPQPRVLLWFQRKATSMNERFQRAYLRSWVQVKELGVGEAGFPFVRWIWALFFFCLLLGPERKCSFGVQGSVHSTETVEERREGLPDVHSLQSCARGGPSAEQPHQASSFSAWCPQPGPLPTLASFTCSFHLASVHSAKLVASGNPHPLHSSPRPSVLCT